MAREIRGQLDPKYIEKHGLKQGKTVFEKSVPGRGGEVFPASDVPVFQPLPTRFLRANPLGMPSLTEPDVVRHYTALGDQNYSIDKGFYPLGSCTMKYNPRRHEAVAALEGFAAMHPEQPIETVQGTLEVLYGLQTYLAELTGMYATTLAPMGGAHGEMTGVAMIRAFHEKNGEGEKRRKMLIPDSAHGTNPATAAQVGYDVVEVKSGPDGNIDMEDFRDKLGDGQDIAGIMITQPNTLGLFDTNLQEVAAGLHQKGALVYGDGANMNALMGKVKPADLGIDVMHINTHKALTTPHGGGGPGAGPVMVTERLADFLPDPLVVYDERLERYMFDTPAHTIGRVSGWYGNVGVLLRAFSYIRTMGEEGLREASETAVLNANFLRKELEGIFPVQYGADRHPMHEVVFQAHPEGSNLGPQAPIHIAKRLIDYGIHPPTVAFPLIVDGALMVEPTETEGMESLLGFVGAMMAIAREAVETPEVLMSAPHFTPVGRLDEAKAARPGTRVLGWEPPVVRSEK